MRPDVFQVRTATLRDGVPIAYVREGIGGVPLLLLHGWPSTKRIFYRNIGPLSKAGFDVVAPDASGWGDSPVHGRFADPVGSAHTFTALMQHLGHERWVLAAFDFGSMTAMHMVNRFERHIIRQVLWNALVPDLPELYERAGVGGNLLQENISLSTHVADHGTDPDSFAQRYDSPDKRRRYVMGFYQGRVWKQGGPLLNLAAAGNFDDETAAFHAQPFEDATVFRVSLNYYAALFHPELFHEPPLLNQEIRTETMFLYGLSDQIIGQVVARRAEIAYSNLVGPFIVEGGGHFLCWERPTVFNSAVMCFCRDLIGQARYSKNADTSSSG